MYPFSESPQTATTTRAIPESTPWLGALIAFCKSKTMLSCETVTGRVGDEVVSRANVNEPVSPGCCTHVHVTITFSLIGAKISPRQVPTYAVPGLEVSVLDVQGVLTPRLACVEGQAGFAS